MTTSSSSSAATGPDLPDVTLLVFSCTGRAHLLQATLASFRRHCPVRFAETIYAQDGEMDPAAPGWVGADRVVQNCQRRGYVQSILQAVALVRTPYLFWLEDDWDFTRAVDLPALYAALVPHPDWMQIRLSKVAPLPDIERTARLGDPGLHRSGYGFSANPHLGRTEHIRAGFLAYYASPRTAANTFESFLSDWIVTTGLVCAVVDPGETLPIQHSGYLESTGRQWHAAVAFDGRPGDYASGFSRPDAPPPLWRRLLLAGRLVGAALVLAGKALRRTSAYDLGFRFINLCRQKDE